MFFMTNTTNRPDLLGPDYWNGTIRMSLSKFFILCVLLDRPLHGYDIAKEVQRRDKKHAVRLAKGQFIRS